MLTTQTEGAPATSHPWGNLLNSPTIHSAAGEALKTTPHHLTPKLRHEPSQGSPGTENHCGPPPSSRRAPQGLLPSSLAGGRRGQQTRATRQAVTAPALCGCRSAPEAAHFTPGTPPSNTGPSLGPRRPSWTAPWPSGRPHPAGRRRRQTRGAECSLIFITASPPPAQQVLGERREDVRNGLIKMLNNSRQAAPAEPARFPLYGSTDAHPRPRPFSGLPDPGDGQPRGPRTARSLQGARWWTSPAGHRASQPGPAAAPRVCQPS